MNKLKIGIIGVGSISEEHIEAYLRIPEVELYAFCDLNPERLDFMSKKYNITRTFTDYDEMLKCAEIDAVSVCVWNSQHAPCAIAALKAGKHVLCEKPMATSAEEGRQMLVAAKESGKLLMIGFVRRYGQDTQIIQDFKNDGFFGELYYGKAVYLRRHGNPGGWFGDKSRSGGGPLIDLAVHTIDLLRYLFGNPKPVSVYGVTFKKELDKTNLKDKVSYESASKTDHDINDVETLAMATIRFDTGAVISVEVSFELNIKEPYGTLDIYGDKGGAKLMPTLELYNQTSGYLTNVGLNIATKLDFDILFESELRHFVDCIQNGTQCKSPAEDGVEIMRILDAIYESARTGHEVVL